MLVMTAKLDKKKIAAILIALALAAVGLVLLFSGGGDSTQPTVQTGVVSNDDRVKFLTDQGWQVTTSPQESGQVKIPAETSQVFDRYNALQKSQGYDLTGYAGKNVMRYVYKIENYPGATEPVYATLLVHKDQIIGGDITDTAPGGQIRGFKMPEKAEKPTETTQPTE